MQTDTARILIIGAGVNGSICARGLARAGFPVTVLARGSHADAIRTSDLVIEDPFTTQRTVTRVPVIETLAPDDGYDYILVIVRRNQVAALLPMLARNRSPNVVFLGNNLSGPDEYVAALGTDRVLLGFVFGAGRREQDMIRAYAPHGLTSRFLPTPVGEIDGTFTPRLRRLVAILRRAGFHAAPSRAITDYLTTHATGVALIGPLILKHGCDTAALARSTPDVQLYAQGYRESGAVLRALGHHIVPRSEALMRSLPPWLLVAAWRRLLSSKMGEVGAGWHCSQAPDEIQRLADDLQRLVDQAGLPVPAIRSILSRDTQHGVAA